MQGIQVGGPAGDADDTGGTDAARAAVRWGVWLLDRDEATGEARLSVAAAVADAASALARAGVEPDAMRRTAVRTDTILLEAGAADADSLRRLASMAEELGDNALALRAWRRLLRARPEGNEGWFEARHETIRLMAESDPDGARAALRQHAVLHSELGPGRWAEAFERLADALGIELDSDDGSGNTR